MKKEITGVFLKTDNGIYLIVEGACSNGNFWNAEGCFKYCNECCTWGEHQASKLKAIGHKVGVKCEDKDWWKNRENFVDIFKKEV